MEDPSIPIVINVFENEIKCAARGGDEGESDTVVIEDDVMDEIIEEVVEEMRERILDDYSEYLDQAVRTVLYNKMEREDGTLHSNTTQ